MRRVLATLVMFGMLSTLCACYEPKTALERLDDMTVKEIADLETTPVMPELTAEDIYGLDEETLGELKEQMQRNLEIYKARNTDVEAILKAVGLGIDQPVVCAEDNFEYLEKDAEENYDPHGALFFDERIQGTLDVPNLVIFGHNKMDGQMFSNLLGMENITDYSDALFMLYNDEGLHIYAPFSAYRTTSTNDYINPYPGNIEDVLSESPGMPSENVDRILTLSTCTNDTSEGRFVVHAELLGIY